MNHTIHIAAISQIRLDYRRRRAEGKKPLEAIRCLKAQNLRRHLLTNAHGRARSGRPALARAENALPGRLENPARSTYPRTSTLRISHFPDPRRRRYPEPVDHRREPE